MGFCFVLFLKSRSDFFFLFRYSNLIKVHTRSKMVKSQINEGGKEGEKFTDHLEMKETFLDNGLAAQWWSKR